jgi:hypothetical protein
MMQRIAMNEKDWYAKAMVALAANRELVIAVDGSAASRLRRHLTAMSERGQGAGYWNILNMLRYRRFHRVFFSALAFGLGVSIEDTQEGKLLILMNQRVGNEEPSPRVLVVQRARTPSAGPTGSQ